MVLAIVLILNLSFMFHTHSSGVCSSILSIITKWGSRSNAHHVIALTALAEANSKLQATSGLA